MGGHTAAHREDSYHHNTGRREEGERVRDGGRGEGKRIIALATFLRQGCLPHRLMLGHLVSQM